MERSKIKMSGFSVIELFITLGITFISISVLFFLTGSVLKDWVHKGKLIDTISNSQRFYGILSQAMRDFDSYKLPIEPRIHVNGEITYFDGIPIKVGNSSKKITPDGNSEALSIIKLKPSGTIKVLHYYKNENRVRVCKLNEFSNDLSEEYIGVSPDKLMHVKMNSPCLTKCCDTTISIQKSLFLEDSLNISIPYIRALVPIKTQYTIYMSEAGILRYIQYKFGDVVENQPLFERLQTLKFEKILNENGDFKSLSVAIKDRNGTRFNFSVSSSLEHEPLLNFILNL